jgi:hypothetical protein
VDQKCPHRRKGAQIMQLFVCCWCMGWCSLDLFACANWFCCCVGKCAKPCTTWKSCGVLAISIRYGSSFPMITVLSRISCSLLTLAYQLFGGRVSEVRLWHSCRQLQMAVWGCTAGVTGSLAGCPSQRRRGLAQGTSTPVALAPK